MTTKGQTRPSDATLVFRESLDTCHDVGLAQALKNGADTSPWKKQGAYEHVFTALHKATQEPGGPDPAEQRWRQMVGIGAIVEAHLMCDQLLDAKVPCQEKPGPWFNLACEVLDEKDLENLFQPGATGKGAPQWTPIASASEAGHLKNVKVLIKHGASLMEQDCNGKTALEECLHSLKEQQLTPAVLAKLDAAGALTKPRAQVAEIN